MAVLLFVLLEKSSLVWIQLIHHVHLILLLVVLNKIVCVFIDTHVYDVFMNIILIFFISLSARLVSGEVLNKYLEEKIFPKLREAPFSVFYVHTGVQRSENYPGISALRSIYNAIPMDVQDHLEHVYFVHPSLQARLFLATFGRLIFSGG